MIRRFIGDDRASIPIMMAVLLVPLLIVVGAGIDFMRHEVLRSKLQDSLDRGVLAAASLNQTMDAEATIRGHLLSAHLPEDIALTVAENKSLNHRRIAAEASIAVPPSFLALAGIGDLTASASSIAEESRKNIEISLILDVSGSMVDKGVFGTMKNSARDFVSTVLRPEVAGVTSLNIIPFAGDVSVGKDIFSYLSQMGRPTVMANHPGQPLEAKYRNKHELSWCFDFQSDHFSKRFPYFPDIEQTSQFSKSNYGSPATKEKWWCPSEDTAISLMSNDLERMRAEVTAMKSYDGTGTHIAMKWALMMLDPVIRPYVALASKIPSTGIPEGFKDRPADFDDEGTKKFIILMTDGETASQDRPKNISPGVYLTADSLKNQGGGLKQKLSSSQSEKQMMTLCDEAKTSSVTVFTIGFKITGGNANHFYKQLEKCASSPSHFYRVDDLDIGSAFQSIASAIQRIRLVSE